MMQSGQADRASRESDAYDEGQVWAASNTWHVRALHVLICPNTLRAEALFEESIRTRAIGASVLDVGCGHGSSSAHLHEIGAASVLGIDVSASEIEEARANYGERSGLSFAVHSAEQPIEGNFDLIVGRSVLHHIDFRRALPTMFDGNLAPGGRLVFMEPMSNPLTLLFHRFVRSAHTDDEWPLTPDDVRWLKSRFGAQIRPVNLFSFPAAAISSLLFSSPDNLLVGVADTVDRALEKRPSFAARGRQGIILIDRI